MPAWNPSKTEREWISVISAISAVIFLGMFPKTAGLARGIGVLFIVILLLNANAIARLQNYVKSIGGPTV